MPEIEEELRMARAQSLEQGLIKGIEKRSEETAKLMIEANEPDWKIISYTGLKEEQLKALRKKVN